MTRTRTTRRLTAAIAAAALVGGSSVALAWEAETTHGGWYRASLALKRILIRAGVPATAQT